jgi:hypothetical protein
MPSLNKSFILFFDFADDCQKVILVSHSQQIDNSHIVPIDLVGVAHDMQHDGRVASHFDV